MPAHLLGLPHDVLLIVLHLVPRQDRFLRLRPVCKRLASIIPTLETELTAAPFLTSIIAQQSGLLRQFTNVHTVYLCPADDVTTKDYLKLAGSRISGLIVDPMTPLAIIPTNLRLTRLCYLAESDPSSLIAAHTPTLVNLSLAGLVAFRSQLRSSLTALRSLSLVQRPEILDTISQFSKPALSRLAQHITSITSLSHALDPTEQVVPTLRLPLLRELELINWHSQHSTSSTLCAWLTSLTSLRSLSLSLRQMNTLQDATALHRLISSLPQGCVARLSLSQIGWPEQAWPLLGPSIVSVDFALVRDHLLMVLPNSTHAEKFITIARHCPNLRHASWPLPLLTFLQNVQLAPLESLLVQMITYGYSPVKDVDTCASALRCIIIAQPTVRQIKLLRNIYQQPSREVELGCTASELEEALQYVDSKAMYNVEVTIDAISDGARAELLPIARRLAPRVVLTLAK